MAMALLERAAAILIGDSERPTASGNAPAAAEATNELILAARAAISDLFAERRDDIRRSCAPALVDKEEALGYLLADALGRQLLTPEDARAVGKRAGRQAKAAGP